MKLGCNRMSGCKGGFTRTDLAVLLGACLMLGALAVPLLGNHSARNDQVVCVNNLRLIGQAYLQWAQDHGETYPWDLTQQRGGTIGHPLYEDNLWFHFFSVSNELRSPRYLADPADDWPTRRVATTWGREPSGLMTFQFQNNAVSYFLSTHATVREPNSMLAGDYHLRVAAWGSGCRGGFGTIGILQPQSVEWTGNVHGHTGNIVFNDGRVEQLDTPGLKETVAWNQSWNNHLMHPRR